MANADTPAWSQRKILDSLRHGVSGLDRQRRNVF